MVRMTETLSRIMATTSGARASEVDVYSWWNTSCSNCSGANKATPSSSTEGMPSSTRTTASWRSAWPPWRQRMAASGRR